MKTLKEIIQANDRMIFISPKYLRSIKIGLDYYAPSASVMVSFDGENFDDEELTIGSGESLVLSTGVKIVAIKMEGRTTANAGMIFWSF